MLLITSPHGQNNAVIHLVLDVIESKSLVLRRVKTPYLVWSDTSIALFGVNPVGICLYLALFIPFGTEL